jgi:hypothetical protein
MTTQARAQFERLTLTGSAPTVGQPGAFALNLADRKLWTFDATGAPISLGRAIDMHNPARAYATGDIAIVGDTFYRAGTGISPGSFNPAQWAALTGLSGLAPSDPAVTGLISGGVVSAPGGNTVQVAAGTGVVVDASNPATVTFQSVSWSGLSASVSASGETIRAITINSAGAIGSSSIANLPIARRSAIVVGFVVYDAAGNIITARNIPTVTSQATQDVSDLIHALGGPFKVSGAVLSAASGMAVNVSAGHTFALHSRWRSVPTNPSIGNYAAATPLTFDVIRLSGEVVTAGASAVPANVWQGGAQTPGFAVIHYLFATPDGARAWLQLGQTQYAGLIAAEAALQNDWAAFASAFPAGSPVVVLGAIIVTQGATNLTQTNQARVLNAFPGPRAALRFQTSGFGGEFLLTDGSVPMGGDIDMNGNAILNATIDEGTF